MAGRWSNGPPGTPSSHVYWLPYLPADTSTADLVGPALPALQLDYRELKNGLVLEHFEGRSWPGGATTNPCLLELQDRGGPKGVLAAERQGVAWPPWGSFWFRLLACVVSSESRCPLRGLCDGLVLAQGGATGRAPGQLSARSRALTGYTVRRDMTNVRPWLRREQHREDGTEQGASPAQG